MGCKWGMIGEMRQGSEFSNKKRGAVHETLPARPGIMSEVQKLLPRTRDINDRAPETIEDIAGSIAQLFEEDTLPDRIAVDDIPKWIAQGSEKKRARGAEVEQQLTALLERYHSLNLAGFILLPEIEAAQGSSLFGPKLTIAILEHANPSAFNKPLTKLVEINDPQGNIVAHQLLDFRQMFAESLMNITPHDEEYEDLQNSEGMFATTTSDALRQLKAYAPNYLLSKHVQDTLESDTTELWGEKPDALPGVPGGTRDEKIYTFARLQESFSLRRKLGIWEGNLIANPVLPIAPGYTALYGHIGTIEKVFRTETNDSTSIENEERAYIDANDPSYDWIYDSLNVPLSHDESPSMGLNKLRSIWDLSDDLKRRGASFYFDTERIHMQELHPMVRGDILRRNCEFLQRHHGTENVAVSLVPEQVSRILFPIPELGEASEEYLYKVFSSLGMRKKIEDDFGVQLEELSFPAQAQLLTLLNTRTKDEFGAVKKFSHEFGAHGLRTFLVTAQDEQLRDKVFAFAEHVSKADAEKVLAAYASLVTKIDDIGGYLQTQFHKDNTQAVETIIGRMLERGRNVLRQAYEHKDNPEKLLTLINEVNADNAIFYEGFKALRKQGEIKDFSDIIDLSFASIEAGPSIFLQEDMDEMIRITRQNYADKSEEFREAVVKGLTNALDREGTKFYILRHRGKIVGFNRFDEMPPATDGRARRYFGSFNVDPAFGNGKIGDVMIEQTVFKEAHSAIIEAHCLPDAPVTQRYLRDGFVVVEEDTTMYPEPVWRIVLDTMPQASLEPTTE